MQRSSEREWCRDIFGGCLALAYVAAGAVLLQPFATDSHDRVSSNDVDVVPWPFLGFAIKLSPEWLQFFGAFLVAYGLIVATLKFLRVRRSDLFFGVLPAMLSGFTLCDLRFSSNPTQVILYVSVAYLLTPLTLTGPRLAVCLCYFFSGILKCDPHWLTGKGFGRRTPAFLDPFDPAVLATSVCVLELVGPILLITFQRSMISRAVVLAFLVFHAVSVGFVGFYFPFVMVVCLFSFIVDRGELTVEHFRARTSRLLKDLRLELLHNRALVIFIGVFVLLQTGPVVLSEDGDFTGEGKFYRLHMFDRHVKCVSRITFFDSSTGQSFESSFKPRYVTGRLFCHPLTFLSITKEWCRTSRYEDKAFDRLGIEVDAHFEDREDLSPLIRFEGACAELPSYKIFGSNARWIVSVPPQRQVFAP